MIVTIQTPNDTIQFYTDKSLTIKEILEKNKLSVNGPCGGAGICGKCKVKAEGSLSRITETEQQNLTDFEIKQKVRFACLTYAIGDCIIYFTPSESNIQGVTEGFMTNFNKNPITSERCCFGIAIDIGTTTIAGYLYQFPECICIGSVCLPNTQSRFGADLISRISAAIDGKADALYAEVTKQIENIKSYFGKEINTYVITGNTTMLHFLTRLDASSIATAPFTPKSLFGQWQDNVYLPPCISAYVGADITCAILASGMIQTDGSFLLDIGTNGEMVYYDSGTFLCCSTAAGPAFEGVGITCGCAAIPGAINKVYLKDGKLYYTTVDHVKPVGICGSGLIDAISCMLSLGVIDETGYMENDFYIADSQIYITPSDVRKVQLAKSAIRTGIETLCENKEIKKFYIAGGFGSYVDKVSCINIGLIPEKVQDVITVIGNGAGAGACMILQSKECLMQAEQIKQKAITKELSSDPVFMEKYMQYMMFGEEAQ